MKSPLNILLVPNPFRDLGLKTTAAAAEVLSSAGATVACTERLSDYPVMSPEEGVAWADVAVVFGGDGTILRFSHCASPRNLPILGINCGNLGYMAEQSGTPESLVRLLSGDYSVEDRMMLSVCVIRAGETVLSAECLNDAVISYGQLPHLVTFELSERGKPFATYNADGMVFATPTGSTAYSLSAGGPILDPLLRAIVATPVCAHSLTSRPMVFSADADLSLRIGSQKKGEAYLTLDGDCNFPLCENDRVCVFASSRNTRLIRFTHVPFGTVLASKLNNNN